MIRTEHINKHKTYKNIKASQQQNNQTVYNKIKQHKTTVNKLL
jgi:hypothetical protein